MPYWAARVKCYILRFNVFLNSAASCPTLESNLCCRGAQNAFLNLQQKTFRLLYRIPRAIHMPVPLHLPLRLPRSVSSSRLGSIPRLHWSDECNRPANRAPTDLISGVPATMQFARGNDIWSTKDVEVSSKRCLVLAAHLEAANGTSRGLFSPKLHTSPYRRAQIAAVFVCT